MDGSDKNVVTLVDIIAEELKGVGARRKKLGMTDPAEPPQDLFGIALSGGGVRSATVCLGVLKTLNDNGLLSKADYLSTVSGGGYTGGYVEATLKNNGSLPADFAKLFSEEDIKRLKGFGEYLVPGKSLRKICNWFILIGAYLYSFFMNLVWVLSLFVCAGLILGCLYDVINTCGFYSTYFVCAALFVFIVHFFFHGLRHWESYFWSSRALYFLEGLLLLVALPLIADRIYASYAAVNGVFSRILLACYCTRPVGECFSRFLGASSLCACIDSLVFFLFVLIVTGFFANPNVLTFHRFYRDRLAQAYLSLTNNADRAFKLWTLNPDPGKGAEGWGAAPYPLINTCMNLLGRSDTTFKGAKSCDYFLLSPLFCGSKITGYTPTNGPGYKSMTLPTAMAVSGAAVNPNRGYGTNRVLAFFMTILNARLGYWTLNPSHRWFHRLPWWPYYHMMEMLSLTNSRRGRISLSDGGHIENLGVYELLRRRCALIVAVDASADPGYSFEDLQNLIIRARNELGVTITFRERPEETIRPEPSTGYSRKHFVVADIGVLPESKGSLEGYTGTFVYLKSSMKMPLEWKNSYEEGYLYKTYHPDFPHEPTTDQFFDEAQWDAYYHLGKYMAEDMLKIVLDMTVIDRGITSPMTGNQWREVFGKYLKKD